LSFVSPSRDPIADAPCVTHGTRSTLYRDTIYDILGVFVGLTSSIYNQFVQHVVSMPS